MSGAFIPMFTLAYCRTSDNQDGCGWSRRCDSATDDAAHRRVLSDARRHAQPGHIVHVERAQTAIYDRYFDPK